MDPRDLLLELMRRHGDNPNSLARKLGGKPGQPRIHKYLSGTVNEPRRSTMAPIAEHYGISLDALYDPVAAEMTLRELEGNGFRPVPPAKADEAPARQASRSAVKLGQLFDLLVDGLDEGAAFRAASQAVIDALRQPPAQPSGEPRQSAAAKKQGA